MVFLVQVPVLRDCQPVAGAACSGNPRLGPRLRLRWFQRGEDVRGEGQDPRFHLRPGDQGQEGGAGEPRGSGISEARRGQGDADRVRHPDDREGPGVHAARGDAVRQLQEEQDDGRGDVHGAERHGGGGAEAGGQDPDREEDKDGGERRGADGEGRQGVRREPGGDAAREGVSPEPDAVDAGAVSDGLARGPGNRREPAVAVYGGEDNAGGEGELEQPGVRSSEHQGEQLGAAADGSDRNCADSEVPDQLPFRLCQSAFTVAH
jgi:hypothetical protein